MKKIGRTRLIAVMASLALLLVSIPIISYADGAEAVEIEWEDFEALGDYEAWSGAETDLPDVWEDEDLHGRLEDTPADDSPWDDPVADERTIRDDGSVIISASLTYDLLIDAYPEIELGVNPKLWFGDFVRVTTGDVLEVEVGDLSLPGEEIRDVFELDFLDFEIEYTNDTGFVFARFTGDQALQGGIDEEEENDDGDQQPQTPLFAPADGSLGQSGAMGPEALDESLEIRFAIPDDTILSGQKTTLVPVFSVKAGQGAALDAQRFHVVIAYQQNQPWLGEFATYSNEWYDAQTQDGKLVLSLKKLPAPGEGGSMQPIDLPTANGVIANGQEVKLSVQVYYDNLEVESFEPSFTVLADKFGWRAPTNATNFTSGMVLNATDVMSEVYLQYGATNNMASQSAGRAFTGKLVLEDVVNVSEYVQLTKELLDEAAMYQHNDANASSDLKLEPIDFHGATNYIKSFRVTYTVTNKSLDATPGDLATFSNIQLRMGKNVKIDKAAVEAKIPSGENQYIIENVLQSDGATLRAVPCVEVDSANVTGGEQVLAAASGYSVKITYSKSTAVDPDDPDNPVNAGGINKTVQSIAGLTGRNYAYAGDHVVFAIDGFANALKTRALEDFRVVDEINQEDFLPISLYRGTYSGSGSTYYTIHIWMKGDTADASVKINNVSFTSSTNATIDLASAIGSNRSVGDIEKIEFVFGKVNAGFKISNKPTLTMMARTKLPEVTEATMTNTVRLSYAATIEGTTKQYPADAGAEQKGLYEAVCEVPYYADIDNDDKLNKDVIKLRGSEGGAKVPGDLLEYTVTIRNSSNRELRDPFFDDVFIGQQPYVTDSKNTLDSYGTAPFITVVSVTNASGADVKAERGIEYLSYTIGSDPSQGSSDPSMTANTMRIRLKGKSLPGDTIKVSYVMEVTSSTGEIENTFDAWAYPPSGGGSTIVHLGKGHVKPDELSRVKPSLTFKIDVTNNTGGDVNSISKAAGKDEMLDIKATLTSNSPYNATTVTLNSLLHSQYYGGSSYQDALKRYGNGELTATVVHYDKNKNVVETRNNVAYKIDPGVNWSSVYYANGTSTNQWRGGFLLGDDPIELQPMEEVVFTYQIKVDDWADARNNIQRYLSYPTFLNPASDVATSLGNINSTYDGNDSTKTWLSNGYARDIYIKRSSGMYVGIVPSTPSVGVLNGTTLFSGRTAVQFTIYNYSPDEDLSMSRLIVQMPLFETFNGIYDSSFGAASLFEYDVISDPGEPEVVAIRLKSGDNLTIKPGESRYLRFNTKMSAEDNQKAVDYNNPASQSYSYLQKNFPYNVGFYTAQNVLTTNTYPVELEPNADGSWGAVQTGSLYRAKTAGNMPLRTLYGAPGIIATPLKINSSGNYEAIGSEGVTIGQRIAWNITAYEYSYNNYTLPKLSQPHVVIKLPVGMSYGGKATVAVNEYTLGGQNYVVFKLDDVAAGVSRTATIETTGSSIYGEMQAEVYLVTNELFYNVYHYSGNSSAYGSRVTPPFQYTDLGIPDTAYRDFVVSNSAKINVGGLFAFTSTMKVQLNGGATATSNGTDTVESPRDGKNMTYTMTLKNGGNTLSYGDVVLINRMPGKDDKYNMSEALKGSNTPVSIQTEPVVKYQNGATLNEGSDYTITYTSAPYDHAFTHGDYGNGTPSTAWSASRENATAFRLELTNPLAAGTTLEVSFQAQADPDNIPSKNAVAVDTFGFAFNAKLTNTESTWIVSEALPVRVTFPDRIPGVIKGTLFEDDNYDGILNGAESGYTGNAITLSLINASDVIVDSVNLDPLTGEYAFAIDIPGNYTVRIDDLPAGYAVHEEIKSDVQGNKFHDDSLTTDPIAISFEETVIANAALVPDVAGELTIRKTVTGSSSWVGSVNQPFVFRVDYTPAGASETVTFYEVIRGAGSRTVYDLPRGTYSVTEVAGWSTGFSPVGGTSVGNLQITYNNSQIEAAFTNQRDVENYFHAIDTKTNRFTGAN